MTCLDITIRQIMNALNYIMFNNQGMHHNESAKIKL